MSKTNNFLRRLELQGFKSFAGKTILEFPERVTAIVGPNGSGKSNVIDALRWVLGEREAKQLRGDTLENLIFGGTPKKAAAGLAKVSLVFDNRENIFPGGLLKWAHSLLNGPMMPPFFQGVLRPAGSFFY